MFTGLIQHVGKVASISLGDVATVEIESEYEPTSFVIGESIACDGCCLTVVSHRLNQFTVEASKETLARTTLSGWKRGTSLNLERALKVGDALGGHMVQGHVDATTQLKMHNPAGACFELVFKMPKAIENCFIEKGSVALNGVSLTVNSISADDFRVMVIPETLKKTNLANLSVGAVVNVEGDVFGKYVARQFELQKKFVLSEQVLKEKGIV